MYKISDDQMEKVQNCIADIEENVILDNGQPMMDLVLLVGKLIGTLNTIMYDERNYKECCCEKEN